MKLQIIAGFLIFCFFTGCRDQSQSKKIDLVIGAYLEKDLFSGVVLVSEHREAVYLKSFGDGDKEKKMLNQIMTPFRIGSIVKDFTAVCILQLAEEGKLALDDPLGEYLDVFPASISDKITIRQLLRHEAGFGDYLRLPGTLQKLDQLKTVDSIIDLFAKEPLSFEPGTEEMYSNSGYTVLGAIIEKITGKEYAQVISDKILTPLDMQQTYFDWQQISHLKNRPIGYLRSVKGNYSPTPFNEWPSPSGGAYATASDMLRFELSILYDNKLLSDRSKIVKLNNYAASEGQDWGDLLQDDKIVWANAGGAPGTNSVIINHPAKELIIIVLANYDEPIAEKVGKSIYKYLLDDVFEQPKIPLADTLYHLYLTAGADSVYTNFEKILTSYDFQDPPDMVLNQVGYDLLGSDDFAAAIEILKINTRLFPHLANTWDSLGEAYMLSGNRDAAIGYYKKSLALDPQNQNARERLKKLQ